MGSGNWKRGWARGTVGLFVGGLGSDRVRRASSIEFYQAGAQRFTGTAAGWRLCLTAK